MSSTYRDQARAHFQEIFGDKHLWIELSSIEGDPDDRQHCRFRQGWFEYTPERMEELLDRVGDRVQLYGNVYTSITGYVEPKRSKDVALPGRAIFIDDAQPGSYTYTVQTSHDREQAYILLDQDADVATREQIAQRFSRSADRSGWDITQLARVPGTFNTKARTGGQYGRGPRDWVKGTGYRVTLIPRTNRTYTLAELHQRAPKVETQAAGEIADLDWPEVEHWLGNMGPLQDANNIPRRIKPHQQTYRVLVGEVVPMNDKGLADESTKRAFIARGLCWARYPDDAAAAILWRYTPAEWLDRKGTAWHKADIARVLTRERAYVQLQVKDYQIRPITAAEQRHGTKEAEPAPIVEQPARSRARSDRPTKYDAAMLLHRYQQQPELCELKRKDRAARLEISTATLDRLESELRSGDAPHIQIEAKRGLPGRVILLGVINIADVGVLSAAIAESAESSAPIAQNAILDPQCIGETHPPPSTPQPTAPPEAEPAEPPALVEEAFDALNGCKRITLVRIQQYLALNYPNVQIHPVRLIRLVKAERDRRRFAKSDAQEARKAANMRFDVLRRKSRALATQAAAIERAAKDGVELPQVLEYEYNGKTYKTRVTKAPTLRYAAYVRHLAGIYAAEEAKRTPRDLELTSHEIWAQVDRAQYNKAISDLRAGKRVRKPHAASDTRMSRRATAARREIEPAGAVSAAVCSPQTPPAAAGTLSSLLAGIRAHHEHQAGAL